MDAVHPDLIQLYHALLKAKRVLLVAHQKPDGDTTGASSAMLNWLLREGKQATIFCRDLPAFPYIDNIHHFTTDEHVFDQPYDVVIVLDSGDLRYCGVDALIPRLPVGYLFVNIDHHATNTHFGQLNLVFTDASSTAEIVHRFFEANRIRIDDRMATSLLTGLFTDTSNFSNAATTSPSMAAAAHLYSAGARQTDILKHVWKNRSVESLKLWGTILERLRFNPRYNVAITHILPHDLPEGAANPAEGMSNFLNQVTGQAETILVLHDKGNGEIKGSLRSVSRDISKLAKLFGGGGHKKASGFTMKGKIEETSQGPRIISTLLF